MTKQDNDTNTSTMNLIASCARFMWLTGRFGNESIASIGMLARPRCGEHAMKYGKKLMQILLVVFAALQLTACARNVTWEEEVLLNTGETIWVTKEVRYTVKGQSGNPADRGYLPDDEETISFKYGGRSYSYTGNARIMVLAISPQKLPVLLAHPHWNAWYRHNDYPLCATPYYVQFVPDSTGQQWTWPKQIEPWTYNLPTNLLDDRNPPSDMKRRYTMADKAKQTYLQDPQLLSIQKIDPLETNQNCNVKN
jgi:hypothetical protein